MLTKHAGSTKEADRSMGHAMTKKATSCFYSYELGLYLSFSFKSSQSPMPLLYSLVYRSIYDVHPDVSEIEAATN